MTPTDYLNRLLPFDPLRVHRAEVNLSFLLKDIHTTGLHAVKRTPGQIDQEEDENALFGATSNRVLDGYTLLEEAEDEESGRPIRDFYLWTNVARLMIVAGDLATAAVVAKHQYTLEEPAFEPAPLTQGGAWRFSYELRVPPTETGQIADTAIASYPFLDLFPVDSQSVSLEAITAALAEAPQDGAVGYKAMGSIDPTQLFAKLGAYPLAVHPNLAKRSIAIQLHYLLAKALIETGLQLLQHWQCVDTSQGSGVYYFSDGVDAYVMIYSAPILRDALIRIDAACGRTEADGAIVADAAPQFTAATIDEETSTTIQATQECDDWNDPVERALDELTKDREGQQAAFGQPDYLG